jgi:hypothetical protein
MYHQVSLLTGSFPPLDRLPGNLPKAFSRHKNKPRAVHIPGASTGCGFNLWLLWKQRGRLVESGIA